MKRTQHLLLIKNQNLVIFRFEGLTLDFFVLWYWQRGTEKTRCELWWFPGKLNSPGDASIHSRICKLTTSHLYSSKIVVKFQLSANK